MFDQLNGLTGIRSNFFTDIDNFEKQISDKIDAKGVVDATARKLKSILAVTRIPSNEF